MKKFLIELLYQILDKVYPFIKESQRRWTERRNVQLLNSLKKAGKNIKIRGEYTFHGEYNIEIGDNCELGLDVCIQAFDEFNGQKFHPHLIIEEDVLIGDNSHIGCVENVFIGQGTLIARRVCIIDHFHGQIRHADLEQMPIERLLTSKPIHIGRNVWIGEGACILPGVTLGDNCVVGANAVVTHDFCNDTVLAGVPARMLRQL